MYEPPRYMSVNQAATQLIEIIEKKRSEGVKELGKKIMDYANVKHQHFHNTSRALGCSTMIEYFSPYL